ncbi:WD40 repeat domain-containing protein [Streptomyces sp. NPDC047014]|uniref:WD40 repeat domain-containing protein n=1 Tax=Streptomyces sp. NPDC047014 TaxID=3155736 RepID=UPI0033C35ADE
MAAVAPSPDGRTLAVVTGDLLKQAPVRELSLWNLADRRNPVRLPFPSGEADIRDAAFAPDGRTLAVVAGGAEGTLTLWDVSDRTAPRRLSGPTAATDADTVRFSADGRTLITASGLRTRGFALGGDTIAHFSGWQLWDVTDTGGPRAVSRQLGYTERTLAVSPAGADLAVADGHRVAVWRFTDRAAPRRIAVLEHPNRVTGVAYRPDGRGLATAVEGGRTQLWDLGDPDRPVGPTALSGPAAPTGFAFTADGGHVVLADESRTVQRWRVAPRAAPGQVSAAATGEAGLGEAAFSPDGRRLAVGGFGGGVHLWDVTDPARPRELPAVPGASGRAVETLAFDREGTTLAVGTIADANAVRGEIVLWDVSDAERPRRRTALATPTGVASLAFSPRSALLAASGRELPVGATWIGLWDTGRPEPEQKFLNASLNRMLDGTEDGPGVVKHHIIGATPTAFGPDGRLLALSGSLWDVSDPSAPVRVRRAGRPSGDSAPMPLGPEGMDQAAFSPDGHLLAAEADGRKGVAQWRVGEEISYTPVGPAVPVKEPQRIVYHPGGRLLATAERFGAVHLWDVSDPTRPTLALTVPETAGDIRFGPDGRTMALVLAAGGGVRLWTLGELPAIAADPTGLACRIVGSGLSEQDWKKHYAAGLPYQDTCPG